MQLVVDTWQLAVDAWCRVWLRILYEETSKLRKISNKKQVETFVRFLCNFSARRLSASFTIQLFETRITLKKK